MAAEMAAEGGGRASVFAIRYDEAMRLARAILARRPAPTDSHRALEAAEADAAAWKADAGETHLRLAAAEAERDEARAWSAGRAADIVTLGAALGAALAQVEAQDADDRCSEAEEDAQP
jgi:hypothetical protein